MDEGDGRSLRHWFDQIQIIKSLASKLTDSEDSCLDAFVIHAEIDEHLPELGHLTDEIVEQLVSTNSTVPIVELPDFRIDFMAQTGLLLVRNKHTFELADYMTVSSLLFDPFVRDSFREWLTEQIQKQSAVELTLRCPDEQAFVLSISSRSADRFGNPVPYCVKGCLIYLLYG